MSQYTTKNNLISLKYIQDFCPVYINFWEERIIILKKVLQINNLTKYFNTTKALDNIDFEVHSGEIHGLIGANGSGKSTLMNILFGSKHISDSGGYSGEIHIDGEKALIRTNDDSTKYGIGLVHQELTLLNDLSISNNIKINREHTIEKTDLFGDFALVDDKKNLKDSSSSLNKVGINLDPSLKVDSLSTNIKQFIEIAREIDKHNLKLLMLDEPTSSLNLEETKVLLTHLKEIANDGTGIIFTSHRLEEIIQVCDRVTVLRDGKKVNTYSKNEFDINQLALDMIGKEVVQALSPDREIPDENILSFKSVEISTGYQKHRDISLDIKKGEILGITGLAGHGQEMFGYGLMGIYDLKGKVEYSGGDIKDDIYLLPDERKELGLLMDKSVWENIIFETYKKRSEFLRFPILNLLSTLNHKVINQYSKDICERLNIKVSGIDQSVGELSGGNQQKVCVARAITIDPKVLFVGDPTRGIDIYSKEIILEMLLKLNRENGTTVVISSGEISELKRVCDRIAIMYENKVFKIFDKDFDSDEFTLAVSGKE